MDFWVQVQPNASRTEIVGWHGDALRIRISAAPEKGKANAAVVALLANELGVARRDVVVTSGLTARRKRVRVEGVTEEVVQALGG